MLRSPVGVRSSLQERTENHPGGSPPLPAGGRASGTSFLTHVRRNSRLPGGAIVVGVLLILASVVAPPRGTSLADEITGFHLEIYEVHDLIRRPPDFPAPKLGLATGENESGTDLFFDEEEDDPAGLRWEMDELIDLIRRVVFPEKWGVAGVDIMGERGRIVVRHTPEGHLEVARALGHLSQRFELTSVLLTLTEKDRKILGVEDGSSRTWVSAKKVDRLLKKRKKTDLWRARRIIAAHRFLPGWKSQEDIGDALEFKAEVKDKVTTLEFRSAVQPGAEEPTPAKTQVPRGKVFMLDLGSDTVAFVHCKKKH